MAQASSDGGPAGAEGSASTLPAGTIPPKRTMDPGDTPEEVRPPFKKRKPDYREAVEKSLLVAIVYQDCHTKKLTEEEGKHIRRELIQLIDMFPSHSESHGPQFNRSGLDQGVFKVTCADQTSLNWLMESALRIAPVEGHGFQAIELAKLNRLNKVRVWIPGEHSEPLSVLTRLAKQNQGLDTSGWRLLHRQEKPEGQLLVFAVCDASLRVLRSLGGRAHLELSRVTFELPSQGQDGSS